MFSIKSSQRTCTVPSDLTHDLEVRTPNAQSIELMNLQIANVKSGDCMRQLFYPYITV